MPATQIAEHSVVENFDEGDVCPCHGTPHKKTYTFGSTMTAETEVCVFVGCKCAVAIRRDPIGILEAKVTYHQNFNNASGVGKLHAAYYAAKYRD